MKAQIFPLPGMWQVCSPDHGHPGLSPAHILPCLLLWQACASSHSLCSNLSSTWSLSEFPSPPGGPEAAGEAGGSEAHTSVSCHLPQTREAWDFFYIANVHTVSSLPTVACHGQAH